MESTVKEFLKTEIKVNSSYEGITLFLHYVMINQGFNLVAVSEDEKSKELKELPKDWNKNQEVFTFRYSRKDTNFEIILKCLKFTSYLIVTCKVLNDSEEIIIHKINLLDYIKEDFENIQKSFINLEKLEENFCLVVKILLNKEIKKIDTLEDPKTKKSKDLAKLNETPTRPKLGLNIGGNDLYPTFPNTFGGPKFEDPSSGGSLFGPNHPVFQIQGKPGKDKHPNVPKGARFDPFGPNFDTNKEPEPDHFQMPNPKKRNDLKQKDKELKKPKF